VVKRAGPKSVHDLCMWEELPQEKEGLEKEGKR
jgi:hypothetical protein